MGTQGVWGYSVLTGVKPTKVEHKVALVSPRMDVDVTGVSFKNVRTQVIDHPRDEGLKQREQLWNFQQRYRGAIGKLRNLPSLGQEEQKTEENLSDEVPDEDGRKTRSKSISGDSISLQSRVRRRLSRKITLARMRPGDIFVDSGKNKASKEPKDEERKKSGIQRMYSSGFVVKNSLYNQLRNVEIEGHKTGADDSRILEAIEKYGSLEKLPDISFPSGSAHPPFRFLKTLNNYGRRIGDLPPDRRYMPLRRSTTCVNESVSSRRKLLIVSRRGKHERILRLDCVGSDNDGYDDDNDDDDDDDDSDECENGNQIMVQGSNQRRPLEREQKIPSHMAIRSNITQINTQDDMALLQQHLNTENTHNGGISTERAFCNSDDKHIHLKPKAENVRLSVKSNSIGNIPVHMACSDESDQSAKKKSRERERDKNNNDVSKLSRENKSNGKNMKMTKKSKADDRDEDGGNETDDSLDIPDDRYGHTTHTIDKKLSIRKPWEWRPSPYRWTDKAYVRESDKPYIERIINRGEIIDEFNYDSYARTKPLKLQNYPENAGYKDRNGVLR